MLITESKVVRKVPSAMMTSPFWYWMQNRVPYEATGMAASTTETPVTRLSAPQSLQPSSTAAGISPSRMRQ